MTGALRLPGGDDSSYVISPGSTCRTADFDVRAADWPAAPLVGGARIFLQAHGDVHCVIDHGIYATVSDANGKALVGSSFTVGIQDAVQVTPGSTWEFDVAWSNYCAANGSGVGLPAHPARPLQLSVALGLQATVAGGPGVVPDRAVLVAGLGPIAPDSCADQASGSLLLLPTDFRVAGQ